MIVRHGTIEAETADAGSETSDDEDLSIRPYSRGLPLQLMRARELLMQRFRPHFNRLGLTDQQYRILRILVENPSLEILDLSARCCLQPASLSRILPKLHADGIIERTVNPKDQRRINISLTPKGYRLFQKIVPYTESEYARIIERVGEEHMDELYDALERLIQRLQED